MKMNNYNYSLFNASDEWILRYVNDQVFEESLLMNILFQDQMLMHESYFFNSQLLARHIAKSAGNLSLFECAAKKGLVVPAVRDTNVCTLEQAYASLSEGSLYKNYNLVPKEMKPFVNRVVGAVDQGLNDKKISPFYWPKPDEDHKKLGLQYLKLLRQVFQNSNPPKLNIRSEDRKLLFNRVWERTSRWRYDAIEQAATRTEENGNIGIQRMELMRTMGWSSGIPVTETTINPIDIMKIGDTESKLTSEIFIKWLAQCHHLTQAKVFGTTVNFPVYDFDNDFLLDSIFVNCQDEQPNDDRQDVLRVEVELPPIEALIRIQPQELVAVRNDLGVGYRVALKRWENDPSEKANQDVRASLVEYCNQLCAKYSSDYLNPLVAEYTRTKSKAWSSLAKQGVGVASKGLPGAGVFMSLSKLISATYRYVSQQNAKKRFSHRSKGIEINLKNPEIV